MPRSVPPRRSLPSPWPLIAAGAMAALMVMIVAVHVLARAT